MRESCPCRVGLDFSGLLPLSSRKGEIVVTFAGKGSGAVYSRHFGTDTCGTHYEMLLPRGVYRAAALLTQDKGTWIYETGGMRLKEGCQADSLYGQGAMIDAIEEESLFAPMPLKQFATLFILFTAPQADLKVEARLPSSFIGSSDLAPAASPFRICGTMGGEGGSMRLPRQGGRDLVVSFSDKDGESPFAEVDLSPLLIKNGYDFNAPELSDITLTVDFKGGRASIETEGWKESFIIVTF